jgi:hypothetical protein
MKKPSLTPAAKRIVTYIEENPDQVFDDGVVSLGDFLTIMDNDNDIWARQAPAEGGDRLGGPVSSREDIRLALVELRKMGAAGDYYQKISTHWKTPGSGWKFWQKWTDKIVGFENFSAVKKQILFMLMELYYEQRRYFEDNTDIIQLTSKTEQNQSHPSETIREIAPILLDEHSPQIMSPGQNPLWEKLFGDSASEAYAMVFSAHKALGFGAQFYTAEVAMPPGQYATPARRNAKNHMAYLLAMIGQIAEESSSL